MNTLVELLKSIPIEWATSLLLGALKATVIVSVTMVVLRVMRNVPATTRHRLWTMAFASVCALPLVGLLVPDWRALPTWQTSRAIEPSLHGQFDAARSTSTPIQREPRDGAVAIPSGNAISTKRWAGPRDAERSTTTSNLSEWPWTAIAMCAWAGGTCLVFARWLVGVWGLQRIVRRAERVDDATWQRLAKRAAHRVGLRTPATLYRSAGAAGPMTCGWLKPAVVLPQAAQGWSTVRRLNVLTHEMAHILRRDAMTDWIARTACALHWFNPLMWRGLNRMIFERERACDDAVLVSGASPTTYAEQILDVAASFCQAPRWSGAVAMARPAELEGRLLSILDERRTRREKSPRAAAACLFVTTLFLAMIASLTWSREARALDPDDGSALDADWNWTELEESQGIDSTQDWTADDFLHGLRSEQRSERTTAERGLQSRDDNDPVVGDVVDRLIDELESDEPRARHAAVWQLEKTRNSRAFEAIIDQLEDDAPLVRSAAAGALGELGDPRALAELAQLRDDESGRVREWSARALGQFNDPRARQALEEFAYDPDPGAREWAVRSLGSSFPKDAIPVLLDALEDESASVREWAARGLGGAEDPSVAPDLIHALGDSSASVREWSARALSGFSDPAAIEPLLNATADDHGDVREWAARSLGSIDDPAAVDALATTMRDAPANAQYWAARMLGYKDDEVAIGTLKDALLDERVGPDARAEAALSLGRRQVQSALESIVQLLDDRDDLVRRSAATALGKMRHATTVGALSDAMNDPDDSVIRASARALAMLGSQDAAAALVDRLLSGDDDARRAVIEALVEFDSPFADRVLADALEGSGTSARVLRNWIDEARLNSNPQSYFSKMYPEEDEWIILARVYVAHYGVDESAALEFARKAVRKRDAFLQRWRNEDPRRLTKWVKKIRQRYLLAYLDKMAEKSQRQVN